MPQKTLFDNMLNLCIVIVTYKERFQSTESFESILSLCPLLKDILLHVIIYDNSNIATEAGLNYPFAKFIYVHDPENKGVIPAYQYAANYCKKNKISWLLRLDQDSNFDHQFIEEFAQIIKAETWTNVIVPKIRCGKSVISPTYVNYGGLYSAIKSNLIGAAPREITYINSLSFINVQDATVRRALETATYMLDMSDHEFSHKVPRSMVYIMRSEVVHDLSVKDIGKISITRYKSIVENEIAFMKASQGVFGLSVFYARLIMRLLKLVLYKRVDLAKIVFESIREHEK